MPAFGSLLTAPATKKVPRFDTENVEDAEDAARPHTHTHTHARTHAHAHAHAVAAASSTVALDEEEEEVIDLLDVAMAPPSGGAHTRLHTAASSVKVAGDARATAPAAAAGTKRRAGQTEDLGATERARARAAQKEQVAVARRTERAFRGGFRKEEIAVLLEASLHGASLGDAIVSHLREQGFHVLEPVHATSLVDVAHTAATVFKADMEVEPFVAVIHDGVAFVNTLVTGGTDAVEADFLELRRRLPAGTRILNIVQDARKAVEKLQARAVRAGHERSVHAITPDGLDAALMHLYVAAEMELKETASAAETVDHIAGLTRSIAEMPYKMQPSSLAVVTKIRVNRAVALPATSSSAAIPQRGPSVAHYGSEYEESQAGMNDGALASGSALGDFRMKATVKKSPAEMWCAMLQMIPGVSEAKASAIVTRYPTLRSLANVYRDPAVPDVVKARLLEDVLLDTTGRKMTKTSKSVFTFFTSSDPTLIVGGADA